MNINLTVPSCWQDLTPKQLRYVYYLLSQDYSADEVKTYCLCRWSGLDILNRDGDGFTARYDYKLIHLTALQIAEVLSHLDWLDNLPSYPIRFATIDGHNAIAADLRGLTFEHYLVLDNLYTGYLHTQKTDLLVEMATLLYNAQSIKLSPEERISIFYWFASCKQLFARKFPNFFVTAPVSNNTDLHKQLEDGVNAQIRALTKGDITREDIVLKADVYRALTELDALAREYEELNKSSKSL